MLCEKGIEFSDWKSVRAGIERLKENARRRQESRERARLVEGVWETKSSRAATQALSELSKHAKTTIHSREGLRKAVFHWRMTTLHTIVVKWARLVNIVKRKTERARKMSMGRDFNKIQVIFGAWQGWWIEERELKLAAAIARAGAVKGIERRAWRRWNNGIGLRKRKSIRLERVFALKEKLDTRNALMAMVRCVKRGRDGEEQSQLFRETMWSSRLKRIVTVWREYSAREKVITSRCYHNMRQVYQSARFLQWVEWVATRRDKIECRKLGREWWEDKVRAEAVAALVLNAREKKVQKERMAVADEHYDCRRLALGIKMWQGLTGRSKSLRSLRARATTFRKALNRDTLERCLLAWFEMTEEIVRVRRMEGMAERFSQVTLLRIIIKKWFEWVRLRHRQAKTGELVTSKIVERGIGRRVLLTWRERGREKRNERVMKQFKYKLVCGRSMAAWKWATSEQMEERRKGEGADMLFNARLRKKVVREWRHESVKMGRERKVLMMRCVGGWRLVVEFVRDGRARAEEKFGDRSWDLLERGLRAWLERVTGWQATRGWNASADEKFKMTRGARALRRLRIGAGVAKHYRELRAECESRVADRIARTSLGCWEGQYRRRQLEKRVVEMGGKCVLRSRRVILESVWGMWLVILEEGRRAKGTRSVERHVRERVEKYKSYLKTRDRNGERVAEVIMGRILAVYLREWRRRIGMLMQRDVVFEWWREIAAEGVGRRAVRENKGERWREERERRRFGLVWGAWREWGERRARARRVGTALRGKRESGMIEGAFEAWIKEKKARALESIGSEFDYLKKMEKGWEGLVKLVESSKRRTQEGQRVKRLGVELRRVFTVKVYRTFLEAWWKYVRVVRRERIKEKGRVEGGRRVGRIVGGLIRRMMKRSWERLKRVVAAEIEGERQLVAEWKGRRALERWSGWGFGRRETRERVEEGIEIGDKWWKERRAILGLASLRAWKERRRRARWGAKVAIEMASELWKRNAWKLWVETVRRGRGARKLLGDIAKRTLSGTFSMWKGWKRELEKGRGLLKMWGRVQMGVALRRWGEAVAEEREKEGRVKLVGEMVWLVEVRVMRRVMKDWRDVVMDTIKKVGSGLVLARRILMNGVRGCFEKWKEGVLEKKEFRKLFVRWVGFAVMVKAGRKEGKLKMRLAWRKVYISSLLMRWWNMARVRIRRRELFVRMIGKREKSKAWKWWKKWDVSSVRLEMALGIWEKFNVRTRGLEERERGRVRGVEVRRRWKAWKDKWVKEKRDYEEKWAKAVWFEKDYTMRKIWFALCLNKV